jgi:hypothetical protein
MGVGEYYDLTDITTSPRAESIVEGAAPADDTKPHLRELRKIVAS